MKKKLPMWPDSKSLLRFTLSNCALRDHWSEVECLFPSCISRDFKVNAFILQTTSTCWRSVTGKSQVIALTLGNSKSFKHFYHTLGYSICLLTMSKIFWEFSFFYWTVMSKCNFHHISSNLFSGGNDRFHFFFFLFEKSYINNNNYYLKKYLNCSAIIAWLQTFLHTSCLIFQCALCWHRHLNGLLLDVLEKVPEILVICVKMYIHPQK